MADEGDGGHVQLLREEEGGHVVIRWWIRAYHAKDEQRVGDAMVEIPPWQGGWPAVSQNGDEGGEGTSVRWWLGQRLVWLKSFHGP